jgi:uroporphyrinogen-III synthase
VPVSLPGLSLRGPDDAEAVRAALGEALAGDVLVFTSPAAAAHAAALRPLRTRATVLAVGQGTARRLRRLGLDATAPAHRQDSEGLLAEPALAAPRGKRVAVVGAPGGRGLLAAELARRGAQVRELHVYRRRPPRLDRRHAEAVLGLPARAAVLLSSAEALDNLRRGLPAEAWERLRQITAVASSERLAAAAREAGFGRIELAASALPRDLLAAAARL